MLGPLSHTAAVTMLDDEGGGASPSLTHRLLTWKTGFTEISKQTIFLPPNSGEVGQKIQSNIKATCVGKKEKKEASGDSL